MASLYDDCNFLIHDWFGASGLAAWRHFERMAEDADRCAAYDARTPEHRTLGGMIIGGARLAAQGRKAARRYRLVAWVLRQLDEARDIADAAKEAAREDEEAARYGMNPTV